LLQWIRANRPDVKLTLLSLKPGDLDRDFIKTVDEYLVYREFDEPLPGIPRRILMKLGIHKQKSRLEHLLEHLNKGEFDLVYANTIPTMRIAVSIKHGLRSRTKLLIHAHELESIIRISCPEFDEMSDEVEQYICASARVADNLQGNHGIPSERIRVAYECAIPGAIPPLDRSCELFLVGGSGTAHWRKGTDLFIQVAQQVAKLDTSREYQFQWVGHLPEQEQVIYSEDIRKAGLESMVTLSGQTDKPLEEFKRFHLFLMTSREDPFPLVSIEVGRMGIPQLCFEGATGTEEVLSQGGGQVLPYLDVVAMAEAIIAYRDDEEQHAYDAQEGTRLFARFTPEQMCPEYWSAIQQVISS
jgi:glycosyltransferase involved in cell wall biosynthesis